MPKQYRVNGFVRFNNAAMRAMLRAGVKFGTFATLTVPGRKTGRPISTPLVVFTCNHHRYLVASYGVVNWVRNLRAAAGKATLSRGKHTEQITATELPPDEAAEIMRYSLHHGPPGIPAPIVRGYRRFSVLPYLEVDLDSPLEEFRRAAPKHPVFLVEPRLRRPT